VERGRVYRWDGCSVRQPEHALDVPVCDALQTVHEVEMRDDEVPCAAILVLVFPGLQAR